MELRVQIDHRVAVTIAVSDPFDDRRDSYYIHVTSQGPKALVMGQPPSGAC